jgi:hypothetical protein
MNTPSNLAAHLSFALLSVFLLLPACKQEKAKNKDGVECVGASAEIVAMDPPHKNLFYGEVRAPAAVAKAGEGAAPKKQGLLDRLIPAAHAFALEGEEPVANAEVALRPPRHIKTSGAFTTTDEKGRYCFLAPSAWLGDEGWMLEATWGDHKLRQRAVFPHDADINVSSEALVRVWELQKFEPADPAPEAWLNARTVADTQIGLMKEIELKEGESLEALIERIKKALVEDERLLAIWRQEKSGANP